MLQDSLNDSSLKVVVEASFTDKVVAASINREDLTTTTRRRKSSHTHTTIVMAVSTGPNPSKAIKTGKRPKSRMVRTTTSSGMPELTGRATTEKVISTKQPIPNSKRRKEKKHTETYMAMSIKVKTVLLQTYRTCV